MQPESLQTSQPRSKIEFLYRDLLVEYERLVARNEALAVQLNESAINLKMLPTLLRNAAAMASTQISSEALRQSTEAASAIVTADQRLQQTGLALHQASRHNVIFVMSLSIACGVVGGLLGALIMAQLLQV